MSKAMLVSMVLLVAAPAVLVAVGAAVHLKKQRERELLGEAEDTDRGGRA